MNEEDWKRVGHFYPWEDWGDPKLIEPALVFELDKLREYLESSIEIHCGIQGVHSPTSLHYPRNNKTGKGTAVDCSAPGVSLIDFFLTAERFAFNGIGIYTWWKREGLHLDIREQPARWACIEEGKYIALDEVCLIRILRREVR